MLTIWFGFYGSGEGIGKPNRLLQLTLHRRARLRRPRRHSTAEGGVRRAPWRRLTHDLICVHLRHLRLRPFRSWVTMPGKGQVDRRWRR